MTDTNQRQTVLDALAKIATEASGTSSDVKVSAAGTYLAYTHSERPSPLVRDLFPTDEQPDREKQSTAETTRQMMTLLVLVWDEVPRPPTIHDVVAMTDEEMHEVIDWASAIHLQASDNDVEVPDLPDFLNPDYWGDPQPQKQGSRREHLSPMPHQPMRGSDVEAWLKGRRDASLVHKGEEVAWRTLDDALDDYRLRADTGTSMTDIISLDDDDAQLESGLVAKSKGGPHSRACGTAPHEHGAPCSTTCPTCGGRA